MFNPFKPEFTIVIFIHFKPRIAVAILDLQWMKMTWSGWQMKKILLFLKQFQENCRYKTTRFQEIKSFFSDVKWCFNASWGLKGLKLCLVIATWLIRHSQYEASAYIRAEAHQKNRVTSSGWKIILFV